MAIEKGQGETPLYQKVLLGILVLIGFIYFYSNYMAPLSGEIKEAKEDLQEKRSKIVDMQVKAARLEYLEKEYEVISNYLQETEQHLPKTEELPEFIKTITRLAQRFDMDLKNLSIGEKKEGEYYLSHTYSMNLTGDYHTLGQFFSRLGQLERIFSARNLRFTVGEEGLLQADFDIVAYTFAD
ncbi:MAG: type 4a pilus biogenesis protein PilO [Elusimicrobiota bacterium]